MIEGKFNVRQLAYCPRFDVEKIIPMTVSENVSLGGFKRYTLLGFDCCEYSSCEHVNKVTKDCPFISEIFERLNSTR